jgi:hypothetical protein
MLRKFIRFHIISLIQQHRALAVDVCRHFRMVGIEGGFIVLESAMDGESGRRGPYAEWTA